MPEADKGGIDLRPYLSLLKRNAWLIAGVVLVTMVGSLALESLRADAPSEVEDQGGATEATVQVLLQPPPTGSVDPNRPLDLLAEAQVATGTEEVLSAISEATGESVEVIRQGLTATPGPGVSTLLISFGPSERADDIAREVATAYLSYRASLLREDLARVEGLFGARIRTVRRALTGETDPGVRAALIGRLVALEEEKAELALVGDRGDRIITGGSSVIAGATPSPPATGVAPPTPSSTSLPRSLLAALVVGLLLGVGLAFIREHLEGHLHDESEVRSMLPVILGSAPNETGLQRILIALEAMFGSSPFAISVSTASDDESSTELANELANHAARGGRRVVMSAHETQAAGSAERSGVAIVTSPDDRVSAMSDYEQHVADLRNAYAVSVVDSGAVSASAAPAAVARFVDVVAIQVTLGVTKRANLIEAIRELETAGATRVAGILRT